MNANDVWDSFLGVGYGTAFRSSIQMLRYVPAEEFDEACTRIEREAAIGPLFNPTAYLDGSRWKNASDYLKVIKAAGNLRRVLAELEDESRREVQS